MADKFKAMKQAVDAATTAASSRTTFQALMNFCRLSLLRFNNLSSNLVSQAMRNDLDSYAVSVSLWRGAATALILLDRNDDIAALTNVDLSDLTNLNSLYPDINSSWLGAAVPADIPNLSPFDYGDSTDTNNLPAIARRAAIDAQNAFNMVTAFAETLLSSANNYKKAAQDALYEGHPIIANVVRNIVREMNAIPPSGAVAGIYARVDNATGVWKAPANESLNSVSGPVVSISHEEQAGMNVDTVAGKSINAIRAFTGKGTLVWGARTLAGNDNEWRYVNVPSLFQFCRRVREKSYLQLRIRT
jgi:uncharacterized protein